MASFAAAPMLETALPAPRAWHGPLLAREHYLVPIPAGVLAELHAALAELRRAPVPTLLLLPEHFALAATARFMGEVRARLDDGAGFVMLDRLPVDAMERDEAIALYWLLMNFLEPPVAQEWKGTVIYDVRHDGQEYTQDTRVALTPEGLEMHTDSSMGEAPPSYVSLFCLRPARSGGMSICRARPRPTTSSSPSTPPCCAGSTTSSTATTRSTRPPTRPRPTSVPSSRGTAGCARASTRATSCGATRRPAGRSTPTARGRCG